MSERGHARQTAAAGAIQTVATLFGGLIVGLVAGTLVFELLPGSDVDHPAAAHVALAALPAFTGFLAGSALWGAAMGRLAGADDPGRAARAGMLGFAPITIVLAVGLGVLEPAIVAMVDLPIHRVFTILFVPSAMLIAGASTWALGRVVGGRAVARSLALRVALAAGAAFLSVNLLMESLGWVVGGPNAAARATMLTVMSLGNLGAALAGGAVLGWRLGRLRDRRAVGAGAADAVPGPRPTAQEPA